ncbi:regulatory iron-sulfur-containing complex subunit RicT [Flammeovirgaceae bacterium SG7u.111]|nr:regulatory iron-sulfur-containing complex subunit RicT [Flammeovirgaceae bacterium SG7u.132]WPO35698.1 regulatory iron-sulfur-containing complex subunit RicT [Flammeovirgaceae bacterium SG7u.111]
MGCGSCATGSCGTIAEAKTDAPVVEGCTRGCGKLNSFDWLGDMSLPSLEQFNIVEVKFKGGRKDFFRNIQGINVEIGDPVVVEMQNGHHVGYVSLRGELVRLQMRKKGVKDDDDVKVIYRKATQKDLEKYDQVSKREVPTMFRTREIIEKLDLKMKLSDVEFQADNSKATFYYSADERVDFRELIKMIAGEFKLRVEMRQISLRQEASRLGGIGSCGRELCCSTWLTDFKTVSTGAARYQNLSLNPAKLSGQCGRLKCCLNYELETYMDALIDIPKLDAKLKTSKGEASLQKVDIFKKIMWFSFDTESTWFPIAASKVKEIIELNKKGDTYEVEKADLPEEVTIGKGSATINNEDIDRLDKKLNADSKKKKRKKKKKGGGNPSATVGQGQQQGQGKQGNPNNPQKSQRGGQRSRKQQPNNKQANQRGGKPQQGQLKKTDGNQAPSATPPQGQKNDNQQGQENKGSGGKRRYRGRNKRNNNRNNKPNKPE